MLFRTSKRYKKRDISFESKKYALYLRYENRKNFFLHGYFDEVSDAISRFKEIKYGDKSFDQFKAFDIISDDYRVRAIEHKYSEKEITVPSIKEVETRLPELKGFL